MVILLNLWAMTGMLTPIYFLFEFWIKVKRIVNFLRGKLKEQNRFWALISISTFTLNS